jgi:hypothetical protein
MFRIRTSNSLNCRSRLDTALLFLLHVCILARLKRFVPVLAGKQSASDNPSWIERMALRAVAPSIRLFGVSQPRLSLDVVASATAPTLLGILLSREE